MEESPYAALMGASAGLRVMVDGTVRVTIDFEPKDARAAMDIFGMPGQPIIAAKAAIGSGAASPAPAAQKSSYADLGPICREAIDLCSNEKFLEYIGRPAMGRPKWKPTPDAAKGYILSQCVVDSRKDLDTVPGARELFIEHVRKPFQQWLRNIENGAPR